MTTEERARKACSIVSEMIADFSARGLEPGRPDGEWYRRVIPNLRLMLEAIERLGQGDPSAERDLARCRAKLEEFT